MTVPRILHVQTWKDFFCLFCPSSCTLVLFPSYFSFIFQLLKSFFLTFKGQYFCSTTDPKDMTFTSISLWSVRCYCLSWALEFKQDPFLLFPCYFPAGCMLSSCVFIFHMACTGWQEGETVFSMLCPSAWSQCPCFFVMAPCERLEY